MTNEVEKISTTLNVITLVVALTNWSVGTFTSKSSGLQYDVLQEAFVTNVVGKMTLDGQSVEHIFKSTIGPTNNVLKLVPHATQTFPTNAPPPFPGSQRFIIIPAITNK